MDFMDCDWTYQATHGTHWTVNVEIYIFLSRRVMKRFVYLCRERANFKKLWRPKYRFHIFNSGQICIFIQKRKAALWLIFWNYGVHTRDFVKNHYWQPIREGHDRRLSLSKTVSSNLREAFDTCRLHLLWSKHRTMRVEAHHTLRISHPPDKWVRWKVKQELIKRLHRYVNNAKCDGYIFCRWSHIPTTRVSIARGKPCSSVWCYGNTYFSQQHLIDRQRCLQMEMTWLHLSFLDRDCFIVLLYAREIEKKPTTKKRRRNEHHDCALRAATSFKPKQCIHVDCFVLAVTASSRLMADSYAKLLPQKLGQ